MPLRSALPLVAALVALTFAAPAAASPQLQTGIADDAILLHSPERAPKIVARWAAAGIDTVRVQVRWAAIAPNELAPSQPLRFDARDPDDPLYNWAATDRAVALVVANGMTPLLAVTGSGPLWGSRVPSLGSPRYQPDARKFGQFTEAVARRYRRVADRYVIWNEPNQPLWLQPQLECPVAGGRCSPVAPHTYRELLRAAYPAIHRADPGAQVIAGALAPRGADAVQRARGFTTPTGARTPLHLTEFGYQTNPPDPYDGIPPARQSRWLQEAAYVAWRDPRVRTLIQYEWQDEKVKSVGAGRKRYAGWQSGLLFANGEAKPALRGFQHPFIADTVRLAPRVRFWGQVRPGRAHDVLLQRQSPSGLWVTLEYLRTDARGTFVKTLAPPIGKAARYRYRTDDPAPARNVTSDVLTVTPTR